MTEKTDAGELELSDAELMEVLKNHGINRRNLMKVLGAGAGVAALSGTAAAGRGGRDARIDDVFGAPYSTDESPPPGLADHVVELHSHPDAKDGFGDVKDFPLVFNDSAGEAVEFPKEFYFDPVGLHVEPGDVVNFAIDGGDHTVTSFHSKYLSFLTRFLGPELPSSLDRVPEGTFMSPVLVGGESWLYRFDTEGVYDILCLPHLSFGMVMRVVVSGSDDVSGFEEYGSLPLSDNPGDFLYNPNLVLTDETLDPQNIVNEGSIAWGDITPDTS